MNYPRTMAAVLLLTAIASVASAQGLTRAEVNAQLAEAIRNGHMIANGETGLTQRQELPGMYPAQPTVAGKTRAQVEAELAQAIKDGDVIENAFTGKQLSPGVYPAAPVVAGKSRAQVEAELAMAIRDGDMLTPGQSGLTENQLNPQRYASQRAIDQAAMLARKSAPQESVSAAH